jgi:hypothetical protein
MQMARRKADPAPHSSNAAATSTEYSSLEFEMSANNLYFNYYLKGLEAAWTYTARARDHYGQYLEKLEESGTDVQKRLQELAASWQQSLHQTGNGDDATENVQAAWLQLQRQYGEALEACRQRNIQEARHLDEELATIRSDAQNTTYQYLADYFGELQDTVRKSLAAGKQNGETNPASQ